MNKLELQVNQIKGARSTVPRADRRMTENSTNQYWTMRIRPHERLWHIDLGEVRQGLFPPSGGAHRCGDIQPASICHTGRTLCGTLSLFLHEWRSDSPQLGHPADASFGSDDRRSWPWLWHPDILAHYEVSRLNDSLHFHRPTLDVRHSYCLSAQYGGRGPATHIDYG